jgi:D-amino-acid dehydrogenase
LDAEPLTKEQVERLEPGAGLNILGAVHYHCDAHLYPDKLMVQLKKYILDNGGFIHTNDPVLSMDIQHGVIKKIKTKENEYGADVFILAGGSWLPELTKMAGMKMPLMPGKGYSITDSNPAITLNIPAILCEARVAITPMDGLMRYGGTMEIASINHHVNIKRVEGILEAVPKYFSNLHQRCRIQKISGMVSALLAGWPAFYRLSKKDQESDDRRQALHDGTGSGSGNRKIISEICISSNICQDGCL